MAIASAGTLGTAGAFGSGSTLSLTTNTVFNVGEVALLVVSVNNVQTTDQESNDVTSATDPQLNNYAKLGEFTNGQGAAGAGATVAVFFVRCTTQLASGSVVTINFSALSAGDRCASFWKFTVGANKTLQSGGSANNVTDGSNGFGSVTISSLASQEWLFFRGLSKEANSTTQITPTASYTAITATRSRNNSSAMLVRGEFRIFTSTSDTSNPTLAVTGDTAAYFFALQEIDANPTLLPSVTDTITDTEIFSVNERSFINVSDNFTNTETSNINELYFISILESFTLTESTLFRILTLDSILVTEITNILLISSADLNVQGSDTTTISETNTTLIPILTLNNISDSFLFMETLTEIITVNLINILSDIITISEPLVSNFIAFFNLFSNDDIIISEINTFNPLLPNLFTSDSTTLIESINLVLITVSSNEDYYRRYLNDVSVLA